MESVSFRPHAMRYCCLLLLGWAMPTAEAAITMDGSMGRSGSLGGPNYAITSDLGRQVGGNLFQSFGIFNLASGESATFSGPDSVANIIGRVTGGSGSTIDGVLRSTIPGANLYLINPSGLIFGPNASLDLGGSFYASSANYVRLADGGRYDASALGTSSLTAAPPAAFGFLSAAPAPVQVQGASLTVPAGQSLTLVGGSVNLDAALLRAPGGRIALIAAPSGETDPANGAAPPGGGAVTVNAGSVVDVGASAGGSIFIRGGQLQMDASLLRATTVDGDGGNVDIAVAQDVTLTSGGEISGDSGGEGKGGGISVVAGRSISISGRAADGTYSWIHANASAGGDAGNVLLGAPLITLDGGVVASQSLGGSGAAPSGSAGAVSVRGSDVVLLDGGQIEAGSSGSGNGGSIQVSASDALTAGGANGGGYPSGIFSTANGSGKGGQVSIDAASVAVQDGAQIVAGSTGSGPGGAIRIAAAQVTVSGGGTIAAETEGSGMGGAVDISSTGAVAVSGVGGDGSASTIGANTSGTGNGGSVSIAAGSLAVSAGGRVSVTTFGAGAGGSISVNGGAVTLDDGQIYASTSGKLDGGVKNGNAGGVTINASGLTLSNGGQINSNSQQGSTGNCGDVQVSATGSIRLSGTDASGDPSGIFAFTYGDGASGRVVLKATQVVVENSAEIVASSYGAGAGGDVEIDTARLDVTGGGVVSAGAHGSGAGGSIQVSASDAITVAGADQNGVYSAIRANTTATGRGGSVQLTTSQLTVDDGAVEALTTGAGDAGTVNVTAANVAVVNGGQIGGSTVDPNGGKGGSVNIAASGQISVSGVDAAGYPSGIFTNSSGTGAGGSILINAANLSLSGGGAISAIANASGDGGVISVNATQGINISGAAADGNLSGIFASTYGAGNGGQIGIAAPSVIVDKGASVQAGTTGTGAGGHIEIDAATLTVDTGGTITAATNGAGAGGNVQVNATGSVLVTGQGNGQASLISAQTTGSGNGGSISINAPQLTVNGAKISSSSSAGGAGGLIDIAAPGSVTLENGASIQSVGSGTGNAGAILITTGIFTSRDSAVTTQAALASGGNIEIDGGALRLAGQSSISATVGGGFGDGGNVTLSAGGIAAVGGSSVTARADQGHGGRITINADAFLRAPDVVLDASSNVIGNNGVVEVNAPTLDLSASLVVLPAAFLDAAVLLNDPCAARRAGGESSFVIRGRGGVPVPPDAPLPSPLLPGTAAPGGQGPPQAHNGNASWLGGFDCGRAPETASSKTNYSARPRMPGDVI